MLYLVEAGEGESGRLGECGKNRAGEVELVVVFDFFDEVAHDEEDAEEEEGAEDLEQGGENVAPKEDAVLPHEDEDLPGQVGNDRPFFHRAWLPLVVLVVFACLGACLLSSSCFGGLFFLP